MTYRAGLAGRAAAFDDDVDIEFVVHVNALQRLERNHLVGFPSEILLDALTIDRNFTGSGGCVNARDSAFTTACSIILSCCHDLPA